ncbi:hypothetical protein ACVNNN_13715 [Lysinibacillus fusiformis]|uniref:hypothetical protein n=1 Tax=Lysinibacillus sp. PWR01 TaxID=3342384 RepID=UPI00372D66B2
MRPKSAIKCDVFYNSLHSTICFNLLDGTVEAVGGNNEGQWDVSDWRDIPQ